MTVHSLAAYLGVLLVGAAVVSIADSFSAREMAARLKIAGAKAIVTQVGEARRVATHVGREAGLGVLLCPLLTASLRTKWLLA
ncbi:unnamed protein product [Closterium sp. NIES-53]